MLWVRESFSVIQGIMHPVDVFVTRCFELWWQ